MIIDAIIKRARVKESGDISLRANFEKGVDPAPITAARTIKNKPERLLKRFIILNSTLF